MRDFQNAIIDGMGENATIEQQSCQWNGDAVSKKENIYCKENIAVNCNTAEVENIVVADESSQAIYVMDELYQKTEHSEGIQTVTYGNGDVEEYVYNEQGLVEKTFVNGQCIYEYTYDENGNVTEKKDNETNVVYTCRYTEDGGLEAVTGSNGWQITYEYDVEHDINYIFYDINGEKYTQIVSKKTDEKYAARYSSTLISGALEETLVVDESSIEHRITGEEAGISQVYRYNEQSYVESITYHNGDILKYEYTSDYKIKKVLVNDEEQTEYYYDNIGQLIREDNRYAGESYSYVYDANRNMIQKNTYAYSESELANPVHTDYYEYSNEWSDQITKLNDTETAYDGMGNIVSYRDNLEFSWDGKRLSEVNNGQMQAAYTYNDEGIRTSKTINGVETRYLIEGKDIILEENENHKILYIYDADMDITGIIVDGATYYYEKNMQKDVIRILSESGEEVCGYAYDAWGNIVSVSGDEELAELNPIRYRSYYYDAETSLYYVESRYYDSEVGRFISADAVGNVISDYTNLNLYVYCGNDPVNYYDPMGCAKIYLKTLIASDILYAEASQYPADVDYMQYRICSQYLIMSGNQWIESMNKGGSNVTYCISDAQDFYDTWNSLINATVIVINIHGMPTYMQISPDIKITANDIVQNLEKKAVKFVWLISCTAGHYTYKSSNVACAIAMKTSGVVVAPDGYAVGSYWKSGSTYNMVVGCAADKEWLNLAKGRKVHFGWLLYKYDAVTGYMSLYKTSMGTSEVSLSDVSKYLVNNGFVTYK